MTARTRVPTATDHGSPRLPWFTLALGSALLALHLLGGDAFTALVLDRDGVAAGQAWRLLTGHLAHVDGHHLGLNLAALALLGTWTEVAHRDGAPPLGLLVVSGALAVSLGVLWTRPDLAAYCGLSGVLNTVFAAAVAGQWRHTRSPLFALMAGAGAIKIVVEWSGNLALFSGPATGWAPVPAAHGAGYLWGLVLAWVWPRLAGGRPWAWPAGRRMRQGKGAIRRRRGCGRGPGRPGIPC
ncbi:MAG: rhombosortase [Hyphomicrobiales bacterium]|nr:rhombosortase [Hyphomicrobiales bacterium]MCP5372446.1 rhombosortase [Hyphomicrobiales bacterium]